MKVLVTGATGFIGSHIVDQLLERGFEVRCTIRKTSNLRWLNDKPVELAEAALSDPISLKKACKNIDYVIHSAGLTYGRNLDDFMRGNRDGTKNLLDAVLSESPDLKRFVFLGSQTVAGPSESLEKPVTEDMECRPLTKYAVSKKAAEDEVLKLRDKMPITVVRAPAVYGPRDTATFDIFKTIYKGLSPLIGLKPKFLSLIHVHDLARGTIEAMLSERAESEIYFVSSRRFYSWDEINKYIKEGLGKEKLRTVKIPHSIVLSIAGLSEFFGKFSAKPPVFNLDKGRDFIQDYWTCSPDKAKNHFNFESEISLEEGLKKTARWYLENKWL